MRTEDMLKALHLPDHNPTQQELDSLKSWCRSHVSQDLDIQGSQEEQYQQYANLAAKYRTFCEIVTSDPLEINPKLDQLNAIQFAAMSGFDVYLQETTLTPEQIDSGTKHGNNTALHLAASAGRRGAVDVCLSKGARLDVKNTHAQYPAMKALMPSISAQNQSVQAEIFEKLSHVDGLLSHRDQNGETVFHMAARFGLPLVLEKLLQQRPEGALEQNADHQYPIQLAILQGDAKKEVLMQLLHIPDVMRSKTNTTEEYPLHEAARYLTEQEFTTPFVIASQAAGVELNVRNQRGETPLMLASAFENKAMIASLIERGLRLKKEDIVYAFNAIHGHTKHEFCQWMLTRAPEINPDILEKLQKQDHNSMYKM